MGKNSRSHISTAHTDEISDIHSDLIVPEGCIYVLGDNRLRGKSRDSRVFRTCKQ